MSTLSSRSLLLHSSIRDAESPWLFNGWYLEFRIDEEIQRCKRYMFDLAVLVLTVQDAAGPAAPRTQLNLKLAASVRPFDVPSVLGEPVYGFCLVQCDEDGAETVSRRLVRACAESGHAATAGLALYPRDGSTARALLATAGARSSAPGWGEA